MHFPLRSEWTSHLHQPVFLLRRSNTNTAESNMGSAKGKKRSLQLSAGNNSEWESVCERERARGRRITRRGRGRHLFNKMFNVFWQVSYVRCWESGCARQHSSGLTSAAVPDVGKNDRTIYSAEGGKKTGDSYLGFVLVHQPRGDAAASTIHSFTLF